ncbi:MAG: hypothetical protein WCK46_02855 [Candidatus Adlerbacteria bacterium]
MGKYFPIEGIEAVKLILDKGGIYRQGIFQEVDLNGPPIASVRLKDTGETIRCTYSSNLAAWIEI